MNSYVILWTLQAACLHGLWHSRQPSKSSPAPQKSGNFRRALFLSLAVSPTFAHAATANLRESIESNVALAMYVCGFFVALCLVTAGVMQAMNRPGMAKGALGGAIFSAIAIPLVKAIWSNVGLVAPDASSFNL